LKTRVLIQEIVMLMYTEDRSMRHIVTGMHIHPALSEVVEREKGRRGIMFLTNKGTSLDF
jgi:hypothetical protein